MKCFCMSLSYLFLVNSVFAQSPESLEGDTVLLTRDAVLYDKHDRIEGEYRAGLGYVVRRHEGDKLWVEGKRWVNVDDVLPGKLAIKQFTKHIRQSPSAKNYKVRGLAWHSLYEWERAIADFSQAIAKDSKDATTYVLRAEAYSDLKIREKAMRDCDRAISLNPTFGYAYYLRGAIKRRTWSPRIYPLQVSGLNDLYRAAELDRGICHAARLEAACAWQQLNHYQISLEESTDIASRYCPDSPECHDFNLLLQELSSHAYCQIRMGRYQSALDDLRNAIAIIEENKPEDLFPRQIWYYRGLSLLQSICPKEEVNNGGRAIVWAEKAWGAALSKTWKDCFVLAAAYAEAGNFKQARRYGKMAVEKYDAANIHTDALELYRENKPMRASSFRDPGLMYSMLLGQGSDANNACLMSLGPHKYSGK